MPRPVVTDYYQAYRFAVSVGAPADSYILTANAGFNNITTPEATLEAAEYREGVFIWTRKQQGIPTLSDATFQQGTSSIHTDAGGGNGAPFYAWLLAAINGQEYRADLQIWHIHRADVAGGRGAADFGGVIDTTSLNPSRIMTLHEAFPIRCKPEADFDATSSEISIREMDVACEYLSFGVDFGDIIAPGS